MRDCSGIDNSSTWLTTRIQNLSFILILKGPHSNWTIHRTGENVIFALLLNYACSMIELKNTFHPFTDSVEARHVQ